MLGVTVHDAQGVVADLLQKLGGQDGQEWLTATKRFLRKENPWPFPHVSNYSVMVDYKKPVSEYLEDANYDSVNSNIVDENFPIKPICCTEYCEWYHKPAELQLLHFGRQVTIEEVKNELDKQALLPANIWELLAFGIAYPDPQRKFQIVALGSSWTRSDGARYVPELSSDERNPRRAHLCHLGRSGFGSDCHFLAIRK